MTETNYTRESATVVLPDGTELATDIYHPIDGTGAPTLITRTPYSRLFAGPQAAFFAERGYHFVAQDVRGGGLYFPALGGDAGGPADPAEIIAVFTGTSQRVRDALTHLPLAEADTAVKTHEQKSPAQPPSAVRTHEQPRSKLGSAGQSRWHRMVSPALACLFERFADRW